MDSKLISCEAMLSYSNLHHCIVEDSNLNYAVQNYYLHNYSIKDYYITADHTKKLVGSSDYKIFPFARLITAMKITAIYG